jgi:hypothetical protein
MRPLDIFAKANPAAVEAARSGHLHIAAKLYAHGGSSVCPYSPYYDSIDGKAEGYGRDRQLAVNATPEYKAAWAERDAYVLATRDLVMTDAERHAWAEKVNEWTESIRKKFGVWSEHTKRRRHALLLKQFMHACLKEGLI